MDEKIRTIAEACSQPKPRVHELALLDLRPYVESFLDSRWLNSKLNEYEIWATDNSDPLLQRNVLHRPLGMNKLVASIWASRSWEDIYKTDSSFLPPGGAKWLIAVACSLAVLELHADAALDGEARKHIRQRLQAADQLWGMIHECHTFAYFIQQGATIEPKFLKRASREEILVDWKGHRIPVQCKAKMPGASRLISQDAFTYMSGSIAKDAKLARQSLLVRIGLTGLIRQTDAEFLRQQVAAGVGFGPEPVLVTNAGRTFTVHTQPLSEAFTANNIRAYLGSFGFYLGMVIGDPAPNGVGYDVSAVVGIDARPDEKPWRTLRNSIKDGARQLEGGPPGIVAIHYADPIDDFEPLREREPMRVEIGKMLDSLPHVGAVMLSSEPDFQLPGAGRPGNVRVYNGRDWRFPPDFPLGEPV